VASGPLIGLTVAAAAAVLAFGPGVAEAAPCAFWAAEDGADSAPGTRSAPFRTVARLLEALHSGHAGCLVPGSTFAERVVVKRQKAGIALRTGPGRPRARIVGGIRVNRGADRVRLAKLVVQGRGPGRRGVVVVRANRVSLVDNDVSGPFLRDRNVPCILLLGVRGTVIDGNRIHNCTRATTRRLYAPGIHVARATGTTIRSNVVFHNVGDGIALSPAARRTHVHHNLIDGNVGGIYLGGDLQHASSGNRIVDNIVSFSGRHAVHSSYTPGAPVGRDNLVARNCLWRGYAGLLAGTGFRAVGNLVRSPRYVGRPRTYRMRPGPCSSRRPHAYIRRRAPVVGRFLVEYRLLGLPGRVKIVRLGLTGLRAGVRVDLRCVRGCDGVERLRGSADGTAVSVAFRDRWLPRGAAIDVRAHPRGWVGHWARITVVGAPGGVRVEHGCLPPGRSAPVSCDRYRV
jgi:Right handed beta helix region